MLADQTLTEVYLQNGALYTHKSDQVVEVSGPFGEGLQVRDLTPHRYVSVGHNRVSTEGANLWWQLLEKVAYK
jgi:hypothetical protein